VRLSDGRDLKIVGANHATLDFELVPDVSVETGG